MLWVSRKVWMKDKRHKGNYCMSIHSFLHTRCDPKYSGLVLPSVNQGDCAQRICPNRPNCEFRVLLWSFAVTAWKCVKTLPSNLARTDLAASPWQRPVSHFRPHPPVSGGKQNCCYPHPSYSPDLAPCDFFLFPKLKLKLKGHRFDTITWFIM